MTAGTTKVALTFRIYRGGELTATQELVQNVFKIGKLPSCHVRIVDDDVSNLHAMIEVTDEAEVFIMDLGSRAGTVVNGKKVNKCKLQSGDEIAFGAVKLVVDIGAAKVSTSIGPPADEMPQYAQDGPTVVAPMGAMQVAMSAPSAPPARMGMGASAPPSGGFGAMRVPSSAPTAPPSAPPMGLQGNPFASPMVNPFAPQSAAVTDDPDRIDYQIAAAGPPVRADEVDAAQQAVEVVVMWGDRSVLHVAHMSPPRSFYVGESAKVGKDVVDYLMDSHAIGTDRLPIVVESGAGIAVVIPHGAGGDVTVQGQTMTFGELAATGRTQPCAELAGAQQYALPNGATARVRHRNFMFVVRPVAAGQRIGTGLSIDWTPLLYIGGSAAVHLAILIMFFFLPPRGAGLSLDLLTADSRLIQYLMEPPETVEEETPEWLENSDDTEGGKGQRHKGEEGQMGKTESKKTRNRYGIEGPEDNEDPHMAREEAKQQAANAGIIGILRQSTGAWNSPTSPFGRDTALGNDPMSALGALMGDQIGENFGFGGLGLRGTGRGGGGTGEGTIGLGNFGTIGHGAGTGSGSGYGSGAGGFRGRSASVPQIRAGTADVRGSLSKEVIRRVIHRHINEVRFCYEQELNQRPDLAGRVTIAFIISPTGAVQSASVGASTLGNQRVESCVAGAVRRWTFPSPEGGGIVVVNYPFVLDTTEQ